jgi:hypothetical protein
VVVLVELRCFVRRDFDVVHADIFIFDFQVMMRLSGRVSPRKRDRLLRLSIERESSNKPECTNCYGTGIEKQIPRCARDDT